MREFEGDRRFLGRNPPAGLALAYRLPGEAKDVSVQVRDESGRVVRELSGDATKTARAAGLNTVVWDLRVAPLPAPRGPQPGGGFFGASLDGPLVLPGRYTATLRVDGRESGTVPVEVQGDPEIGMTDADRRAHHEAVVALHDLHRQANDAYSALFLMNEQLDTIKARMKTASPSPEVSAAVDEFDKELAKLKPRFGVGQTGFGGGGGMQQNVRARISMLKGSIMGSTSLPTEVQTRQIAESRTALATAIGEVNALIGKAAPLYQKIAASSLLLEVPKALPK
jgi:hypothetical protein